MKYLLFLLLFISALPLVLGQLPVAVELQDDYEASPQHPYGRLNPDAPPETKQFGFLIGSFECKDRVLNPADGKWFDMNAVRRAEYVLNGHAIQDKNYNNIIVSTNIRIYDAINKEWIVSYFKTPFGTGVWKGNFKDGKPELIKGDNKDGSRLSFFDISENGYSWKGEYLKEGKVIPFWEFSCKRKI